MCLRGIVPICVGILTLFSSHSFGVECFALLSEVLEQTKRPAIQTENSKYRLIDSALSYQKLLSNELLNVPNLIISNGKVITELRAGFALQYAVQNALIDIIGLGQEDARHAGVAAHRALVESLGINWNEYRGQIPNKLRDETLSSTKDLSSAMFRLFKSVEINRDFDIPYMAGYSRLNPKYIFVDRTLDTTVDLGTGEEIETLPFLVIHEVVEVALLRRWNLPALEYWRSHQIAQRVERAFLMSHGHSWKEYQGGFVKHNIARLAKQYRYQAIPLDLDYIPYAEEMEHEKVKAMKAAMQPVKQAKPSRFQVKEIAPGVIHLEFLDSSEMAKTFMRFQEYYESPWFRGKFFSTSEYVAWSTKKNGRFTYVEDWGGLDGGFNIPSWVLQAFYDGKFEELTEGERELLAFFETRKHQDFYIIATPAGTETNVLQHELAHAMYYLNPKYRSEVNEVLESESMLPTLKEWLYTEAGDYHQDVLQDEAHAWAMCDLDYMKEQGYEDIKSLRSLSEKLNRLFENYDPRNLERR